jgi:hypothetical protein
MRRVVLLIAALAALASATSAHASGADVIRDCTDDEVLQGQYTQKELRAALANLDADADEYTNCRDVIRQAQLALASGASSSGGGTSSGGGGTTGGGTTTTPGGGGTEGGGASTGRTSGAFGGFADVPTDPSAAATPVERAAIEQAREEVADDDPVEAAGVSLPAPLIGALAVGGLALLVFLALDLRRRIVDRRGA